MGDELTEGRLNDLFVWAQQYNNPEVLELVTEVRRLRHAYDGLCISLERWKERAEKAEEVPAEKIAALREELDEGIESARHTQDEVRVLRHRLMSVLTAARAVVEAVETSETGDDE